MFLLKQSTAVILKLGPFVDDTDGKTAETGLTIAQADIQISKNGAAFAQTSDASPTTTHDADGWYPIPLTTTDTGTLGTLTVQVAMAGALPVWKDCMVLPAAVYDSLVAGSDTLPADVTQIGGVAQSATDLKDFADTGYDPSAHKVQGVVLADTVTTLTGHTAQTGDSYAYLGTNLGALGANATEAGGTGDQFTGIASVGAVAGAVGSVTGAVGSVTGAVGSVTGNVGGNVTGSVGSVVGHTPQTGDTYALANGASGFVATKAVLDTAAADVANIDGAAMRGTDGANTTVPDAAGTAAALHATTDGLIGALNDIAAADVVTALLANAYFKQMLAKARGKTVWDDSAKTLKFYDTDDATLLFTLTLSATGRTVA